MIFYVSSVLRDIPNEVQGGLLGVYNWDTSTLDWVSKGVFPLPYCGRNGNPRGGVRGYKGILIAGNEVWANNFDGIVSYSKDMSRVNKIISHPAFCQLHNVSQDNQYFYTASTGIDSYCRIDKNFNIEVIEPMADPLIYKALKPYLHLRQRDRRPYNPQHDYREKWIQDVLNFNYIVPISNNRLLAIFNSIGCVVQLKPTFEILWSPPLEDKYIADMPLDFPGLNCAHDIVEVEQDIIMINSSRSQKVYTLNLNTKKLELFYSAPAATIWLRGLEKVNDKIYIGTGRGSIMELDYRSKQLIQEKVVFPPYDNEHQYSIFAIKSSL